jgi:hypothetical protein
MRGPPPYFDNKSCHTSSGTLVSLRCAHSSEKKKEKKSEKKVGRKVSQVALPRQHTSAYVSKKNWKKKRRK